MIARLREFLLELEPNVTHYEVMARSEDEHLFERRA